VLIDGKVFAFNVRPVKSKLTSRRFRDDGNRLAGAPPRLPDDGSIQAAAAEPASELSEPAASICSGIGGDGPKFN
jgi:hypothetical protein